MTANLTSLGLPDDRVPSALKSDLRLLYRLAAGADLPRPLGGTHQVCLAPRHRGKVSVWAVPNQDVAADGSDYYTLKVLRNGQDESAVGPSTANGAWTAFQEVYLGLLAVETFTVLELELTPTGAPSPSMTVLDFTLAVRWVE